MEKYEFLTAIFAIILGTGLTGFLFYNVFGLVKAWINRNTSSSNGEINPQFFKALGEFKKTTEKRISNLEAIISDLEEEKIRILEDNSLNSEITIEDNSIRSKAKNSDNSNLRNMLNE